MPSRPGTADATVFNKKLRKNRTFLKDNEAADSLLPQPLPDGIPYVAQFTTFDDLIDRKILQQSKEQQVHLSGSDVKLMYEAKCLDQNLKPTWEREVRFMELLSSNCKGGSFALKENGLGHASAEAIARVLAHNDHYSIVDLSGNRFRDSGAECIARLLTLNDTIVHLSLKSNDIGHDGGAAIAQALEENCTLTSLDLGGISGINRNHLGSTGAAAVGQMLASNQVLAYLDVSSNGLGGEGIKLLAQGLKEGQNTTMVSLNLASNNLGTEGSEELGPVLEGTALEFLDLQRNALGDRGVACIVKGLRIGTNVCDTLTELYLDSNSIHELGCKAIGKYLRGTTTLLKMTLSDNHIGSGLHHVMAALAENKTLEELRLAHCMLNSEDGDPIGSMVSKNVGLKLLDLSKNRLSDKAVKIIADAMRGNKTLETLDLASNGINDAGGEALALMIRQTTGLCDLSIRPNMMTTSGNAIEEQLRRNHVLRKLDFSYNDFSYQAYSGILHTLARNMQLYNENEVPRLNNKIEKLGTAKSKLMEIQDDIDKEKFGVRQKTEDFSRLRETIQTSKERHNRTLAELKEQVDAGKAEVMEREEKRRVEQESTTSKIQRMEQKASQLRNRVENEHERKEKAYKDIDRVKKQLKTIQDATQEALAPLLEQFKKVDNERLSDLADAKWQGENLVTTEMKIADLERALGLDKLPVSAPPPPAQARGGSARPGARRR